jgi:hypothetical protein
VSLECRDEFFAQAWVGQDQDFVSGPQPHAFRDGYELAVSYDEADPCVSGKAGYLADGAAVGGRACLDGEVVHAAWLVLQPYPQGPGLRFD